MRVLTRCPWLFLYLCACMAAFGFVEPVIEKRPWMMLVVVPSILLAGLMIVVALLSAYVCIRTWNRRHDFENVMNGGCLHCGYDLRGSTDRCPECGRLTQGRPNVSPHAFRGV